jgi:hypothetical protein
MVALLQHGILAIRGHLQMSADTHIFVLYVMLLYMNAFAHSSLTCSSIVRNCTFRLAPEMAYLLLHTKKPAKVF